MSLPSAGASQAPFPSRIRVLHFVSGGFSGATQVAVELCRASMHHQDTEAMLVLRRKRNTDAERVQRLQEEGLSVQVVPGWSHAATIWRLVALCQQFRPDILVVHGFSEHLMGRYAGLLAGVPAMVHVEHNSRERYTRWRLAQALWLARRTSMTVGCSEGVRQRLKELGFPDARLMAIPNGVRLAPFDAAIDHPFEERTPGIVMSARFAKQKDHLTLLRAVALLAERGLRPPVLLAGAGKARYRKQAEQLAVHLGIADQVRFLGFRSDVPRLLMSHQICVLSTHYEGMPLALVEGMAAGCAVVASDVVGVQGVVENGIDGRLSPEGDSRALADILEGFIKNTKEAGTMAARAREAAHRKFGLDGMVDKYDEVFRSLVAAGGSR